MNSNLLSMTSRIGFGNDVPQNANVNSYIQNRIPPSNPALQSRVDGPTESFNLNSFFQTNCKANSIKILNIPAAVPHIAASI